MKNLKSLDLIRIITATNLKNEKELTNNSKRIEELLKSNQRISIKIQEDIVKLEEAYKNAQEEIDKIIMHQIINSKGITQKIALATLVCETPVEDILNINYDNRYGFIEINKNNIVSTNGCNILKISLKEDEQTDPKLIHWSYVLRNKNCLKSHKFSFKSKASNCFNYFKTIEIKDDFYKLPFVSDMINDIKIRFDIPHIFWIKKKEMDNILLMFRMLNEDFTIKYNNISSPIVFKSRSIEFTHSNHLISEVSYDN